MQLVSILDFSIPFMFSRKAICIVIYNTEIIYNTRAFIHVAQRWWLGVGSILAPGGLGVWSPSPSPRIAWQGHKLITSSRHTEERTKYG